MTPGTSVPIMRQSEALLMSDFHPKVAATDLDPFMPLGMLTVAPVRPHA